MKRDWRGAVADYTRAIELDPENEQAYIARAAARKDSGDLAGAKADKKRAQELKRD